MSEVIELICKNCGGKANFDLSSNIFKCEFCDSKFLIENKNNNISMQPLIQSMDSLQNGIDKTASEFAIVRIQKELDNLNRQLAPYGNEWNRLLKLHQSKNYAFIVRKIASFSLILLFIIFIISAIVDIMWVGITSMILFISMILVIIFSAKSGSCRTVIPGHAAHLFRSMLHSNSGASRTL